MKTRMSLDKHDNLVQHQKKMKSLSAHHQNELEKVKLNNTKEVNDLRNSHQVQLNSIRNQHEQNLYKELNHNEEVLQKVKSNLENVKKLTEQEKRDLTTAHTKETQARKKLHEARILKESELASLKVSDINHSGNAELQKVARKIENRKAELNHAQLTETKIQNEQHKRSMSLDKNTYQTKKAFESDKFQRALFNQKKENEKILASNERIQQSKLENTKNIYDTKLKKITEDGNKKNQTTKEIYEQKIQATTQQNEEVLKNIVGKKEKLINNVRDSLTKEYKLGVKKSQDDFYAFGKLQVNIRNNQENDGYIIEVPVADHEAKHVELRAEKRELRLSMQRKYEHQMNDEIGENKISKIESYHSKFPVDTIVDAKTITKDYQDGMLKFEIKYA